MKSFGIEDVISTFCRGRVLRLDPVTGRFAAGTGDPQGGRIALLLGGACLSNGAELAARIVHDHLNRLRETEYPLADVPHRIDDITPLLSSASLLREDGATFPFIDYALEYGRLPGEWREAVEANWGPSEQDRRYLPGRTDCGLFALPVVEYGDVAIGILSADRDQVPRHWELALAFWLSLSFEAGACLFMDDGLPGEGPLR